MDENEEAENDPIFSQQVSIGNDCLFCMFSIHSSNGYLMQPLERASISSNEEKGRGVSKINKGRKYYDL